MPARFIHSPQPRVDTTHPAYTLTQYSLALRHQSPSWYTSSHHSTDISSHRWMHSLSFSPFFFSLLWIPIPIFLPLSPLPSFFLLFTLTPLVLPWTLLSFSLHFKHQHSPLWYLLLSCCYFTPSCILNFNFKITASVWLPTCFFPPSGSKECAKTFSTTYLERILAWWDPHKPDLNTLTLYTEFTALVNQHFTLWLYIFSLTS